MADENVPISDASEALLPTVGVSANNDHFLRPSDGRLVPLLVQSFENGHRPPEQRSWTRIGKPQNQIPPFVRLSHWIWSPALPDGGSEFKYGACTISLVLTRWLISLPLLLPLLGIFQISTRAFKIHSRDANYDPVATKSAEDSHQRTGQGSEGVGTERTGEHHRPEDHSSPTDLQYLLDTLQNVQGADERILHLSEISGTAIDWTCLDPVSSQALAGRRARFLAVLLSIIPVVIICALYILFIAGWIPREHFEVRFHILCGAGGLLMCLAAFVGLGATRLAVGPPDGDIHDQRPRLVGVEGHVDIRTIENHLFGFSYGCLAEVASSSRDQYRDDVSQSQPIAALTQERASEQTENGLRFTLIDTYTMTVYRLGAERPPVAAFICGNDENSKTAVLCSYDWHTNTFCRETTIEVDSMLLDRMDRVSNFRLSLLGLSHKQTSIGRQTQTETEQSSSHGPDATIRDQIPERNRIRKVDLILLPVMWFLYGMPSLAYLNYEPPINFLYLASFLLAQVPAYFLLRRTHIGQAISVPIWLKGAANFFLIIPPHHLGYALALSAVEGAVDGIIFLAFVVISSSWYTPRELLIRILIWTSSRILLHQIPMHRWLYHSLDPDWALVLSPLPIACVLLATYTFHYTGTPNQVRWLPAYERFEFAATSVARGNSSLRAIAFKWKIKNAAKTLRDPQIWLMFLLSALNRMLDFFSAMPTTSAALINICVVAFVCLILSRLRVPFIAIAILFLILFTTGTFVTIKLYTPSWFFFHLISNHPLAFLLFALCNLGSLIPPLIWTLACVNTPDADRRLATLCASFAGYAVGLILMNLGVSQATGAYDGSWVYVVVAAVELGLWVALWAWYVRKNRKARGMQRTEEEDEGEGAERAFRYSY